MLRTLARLSSRTSLSSSCPTSLHQHPSLRASQIQARADLSPSARSANMPAKIAVITYTTWGHIDTLAQAVVEGVASTGAEVKHFQVRPSSRSSLGPPPPVARC